MILLGSVHILGLLVRFGVNEGFTEKFGDSGTSPPPGLLLVDSRRDESLNLLSACDSNVLESTSSVTSRKYGCPPGQGV